MKLYLRSTDDVFYPNFDPADELWSPISNNDWYKTSKSKEWTSYKGQNSNSVAPWDDKITLNA